MLASVAGDQKASAQLFAWIRPELDRYCRARISDSGKVRCAVADVVQDICLAVLEKLPGYDLGPRDFLPYVYGIADHKVKDAFRRGYRDKSDPREDFPDRADDGRTPEAVTMLRADVAVVLDRLRTLPPKQREVVVLRCVHDLDHADTALITGMTPSATRVALHRALRRLRQGVTSAHGAV